MNYNKENIFAKIIRGEISANKVYEDDKIIAFHDLFPAAPTHILVVPKGEYVSFDDFAENAPAGVVCDFFRMVKKIAVQVGLQKDGYRLITNHGENASQTVPHFHMHILGGKALGGLVPGDRNVR